MDNLAKSSPYMDVCVFLKRKGGVQVANCSSVLARGGGVAVFERLLAAVAALNLVAARSRFALLDVCGKCSKLLLLLLRERVRYMACEVAQSIAPCLERTATRRLVRATSRRCPRQPVSM